MVFGIWNVGKPSKSVSKHDLTIVKLTKQKT
jgi:hypothetical protein